MNAKIKPQANTANPCPYCASPDLFNKALALPRGRGEPPKYLQTGSYLRHLPNMSDLDENRKAFDFKTEIRGQYWLHYFTEKNLAARFKGFNVQLLGMETKKDFGLPARPFFLTTIDRVPGKQAWRFGAYFACRFIHKSSPIIVDIHWWPLQHKRIVTLRSLPDEGMSSQELKSINEVLKLVRTETRGEPKISTVGVIDAFQKLGKDASQTAVARELSVSRRALQLWGSREGLPTWNQVLGRYGNMKIW